MILLDTNVVSEAMKPAPDETVRAWLDEQAAETLFLSSVTIAELMFGVGTLPDGKRKDRLTDALDGVIELFADRILPVDAAVARRCARLHVPDPRAERDALIAATALVHGLTVVTRNVGDFAATNVGVLNPWT